MSSLYDFSVETITGELFPLERCRGQVVLIVNTASACGFTPQFAGLEDLHQRFGEQGLTVLGFPCNQFGRQDPGNHAQIHTFCQRNYGVSFAMMAKVKVRGPETSPLYRWLKAQAPGLWGSQVIKWNFTKFLVGKNGEKVLRYAPRTLPQALVGDIARELGVLP
jgi:glutathione peroxidase